MEGYKILIPGVDELAIGGIAFLAIYMLFKRLFYPRLEKKIVTRRDFVNSMISQSVEKNSISEKRIKDSEELLQKYNLNLKKARDKSLDEVEELLKSKFREYTNKCNILYSQTENRCNELKRELVLSAKDDISHLVVEILLKSVNERISEQRSKEITELIVSRFVSEGQ
jgi:F0F1-type ATP synthase membrane subunit b/b'